MLRSIFQAFILSLGLIVCLQAQTSIYHPFPTSADSVSWGMIQSNGSMGPGSVWGVNQFPFEYRLAGTDTIQQQVYQQLYKDSTLIGAIREDSTKKVWFHRYNTPLTIDDVAKAVPLGTTVLLYDFGLQLGDTVTQFHTVGHFFAASSSTNVVVGIDSTLLMDGSYRRSLKIKMHYLDNNQDSTTAEVFWVEGIGMMSDDHRQALTHQPLSNLTSNGGAGPLGSIGSYSYRIARASYGQAIYCFKQRDSFLLGYDGLPQCTPPATNSVSTLAATATTVNIRPNPFSTQTTFDLGRSFSTLRLELYSSTGQLLHQQTGSGSSLTLNRGQLPSGLYLYRLYGAEQLLGVGKIAAD